MIDTFTSTGKKLIFHTEAVEDFVTNGLPTPITVQIAPTSRCNLNCEFCSNVNREKNQDLEFEQIKSMLINLDGVRSIEITGGGDPTLYPQINELILWAHKARLRIGFITNGIALDHLYRESLDALTWLRVSLNSLDYVNDIKIPKIKGTLGFSFVLDIKKRFAGPVRERIDKYIKRYNPAFVRIVPNCQNSYKDQVIANKALSKMVSIWGKPYFYQTKEFRKPKECWWCYFKPFVLHDGWVYPCSSVVLNSSSDRKFHEKFRWCSIEELPDKYEAEALPYSSDNCDHCVFFSQNELCSYLKEESTSEHIYFL